MNISEFEVINIAYGINNSNVNVARMINSILSNDNMSLREKRDKLLEYKRKTFANVYNIKSPKKTSLPAFYNKNGTVRKDLLSRLSNEDIVTYNRVNLKNGVVLLGNMGPQLYSENTIRSVINIALRQNKEPKNPKTRALITGFTRLPSDVKKAIKQQRQVLVNKIAAKTNRKKQTLSKMSISALVNLNK
tara:strand:- start:6 stop:575 length:570 start_codon:yes stop_codon:yes gene_type:complete